jgi:hypothetical protein
MMVEYIWIEDYGSNRFYVRKYQGLTCLAFKVFADRTKAEAYAAKIGH